MSIESLFDDCALDYDSERKILVPCFEDFYGTALEQIPFGKDASLKVLDLGAGTGLFSSMVSALYPHAELTLYDISQGMLHEARKRFENNKKSVHFVVKDYSESPIEGKFDLIISALSIHHLSDIGKKQLFQKIYRNLNDKGVFINADQALGDSPEIEQQYRSVWARQVRDKGISEKAFQSALERMKEDKMSTLADQLEWMKHAGFRKVNCWYKNYSFIVCSGSR
ncbi:MAG: class I SAM-dependent methyltransferase [Spirochaetales bacterium]|nr:class I SAM-dependent methyltransferase [Spirochaetales bacterium]